MACVNPDGSLTTVARAVLTAMETKATPEEIAAGAAYPIFRVRSALRDMLAKDMVAVADGRYAITDVGRQMMAR
jgi:hypothetical protein